MQSQQSGNYRIRLLTWARGRNQALSPPGLKWRINILEEIYECSIWGPIPCLDMTNWRTCVYPTQQVWRFTAQNSPSIQFQYPPVRIQVRCIAVLSSRALQLLRKRVQVQASNWMLNTLLDPLSAPQLKLRAGEDRGHCHLQKTDVQARVCNWWKRVCEDTEVFESCHGIVEESKLYTFVLPPKVTTKLCLTWELKTVSRSACYGDGWV